ncbi:MAG TPA: ABC transporter substrate-binding protein [Tepidisphaeraceae bacterium]|nr:ABC transporter substrate-binding protein [Tepidisphaeraceae bacterium]
MQHRILSAALVSALTISSLAGCHRDAGSSNSVDITLDWKPEPEFGGFYQAELSGAFKNRGLDLKLRTAAAGAPTWQLVADGQTKFATTAADQVLIARARGADVVAIFAVYQTFPQGIMAHHARGFKTIEDVFSHPGTLAAEDDTWLKFLVKKFQPIKVTVTGYSGGVGAFLAKSDYSQQCFVTSEPILAKRQGGDPQTFLIAEAGYNPYTTVLITSGQTIRENPQLIRSIVDACREGWRQYLDDPSAANAAMQKLNTEMDPQTFTEAAAAQKPLIETGKGTLGTMQAERWNELARQLVDLKVIETAPPAAHCFVDPDKLPSTR